jgi:uncharacterized protein (DUF3820 family)
MKIMKKILLYISVMMFAFCSCDQMDDVYDDLDDNFVLPYSENIEYLFNADDYKLASKAALTVATNASDSAIATSIEKDMAFNTIYTAADFVGSVLAVDFPALNLSSAALVTYNNETGTPEDHVAFLDADYYKLDDDNYASVGGDVASNGIFFPSSTPEDNMDDILGTELADAVEGDVAMVTYKYSDTEPGEGDLIEVNVSETDFNQYEYNDIINQDGWLSYNETGTEIWEGRTYSDNGYMQVSAYSETGSVVAWSITPAIDLSNTKISDYKLSFDVNAAFYTHAGLEIFISEDFDGTNVGTAIWVDVTSSFTIPTGPSSGYGDFATAGELDLSSYSADIYVGFKYTGDKVAGETGTFQIDNVVVSGVTEPYVEYTKYYEYSGTEWSPNYDVKIIQGFEYDVMGAPGKYNNFSSSDAPEHYLPIFFAAEYPYSQEGDMMTISYKYYSSGNTVSLLDDYKFESGVWAPVSTVVEETNQFVFGETGWVFDPTVKLTMISADYKMITDAVLGDNPEYGYTDGSAEFYYGSASKYANFDLRIAKRNIEADGDKPAINIPGFEDLTEDEAIDLMWSRIPDAVNILLSEKYPDAVAQANGIDIYYIVTFLTYENDLSGSNYSIKFQCTKSGPNPEFTQVVGYGEEDDTVYGEYDIRKVE